MGGVGSVGVWVRGWRESNFSIDPVGQAGPQVEIFMWVKHDFRNFRYDTMTFYL